MQLPKYSVQERKIHEAYLNNKIEPLDANFCFCGTLSPNMQGWLFNKPDTNNYKSIHAYTIHEYKRMESALYKGIMETDKTFNCTDSSEEAIFNGMVMALEVLKEIHLKHGEAIDEPVTFKKRVLWQM